MEKNIQQVFSPRHQRILWVALSILLQAGLIVVTLLFFSQYFGWVYLTCVAISVLVSLYISTKKTKLAYKVAWIIPILLFPLVGGILYIFLGGGRQPHYQKADAQRLESKTF